MPVPVSNTVMTAAGKPEKKEKPFSVDEGPRADTSIEALAKLRAVFHAHGVVTAGNSSQMSDGAAAAVVMSDSRAKEIGARPLARFVSFAYAGCLPEEMGMGPVYAIPKALKMAGLTLDQIDVIELNEAFAAQALAVIKMLGLDPARVNVNGGRDRTGPSSGLHRHQAHCQPDPRDETARRQVWAGDHVRRWWPGSRRDLREFAKLAANPRWRTQWS